MTWLYVIAGVDVLMFALIGWMCHRAPVREDLDFAPEGVEVSGAGRGVDQNRRSGGVGVSARGLTLDFDTDWEWPR